MIKIAVKAGVCSPPPPFCDSAALPEHSHIRSRPFVYGAVEISGSRRFDLVARSQAGTDWVQRTLERLGG